MGIELDFGHFLQMMLVSEDKAMTFSLINRIIKLQNFAR